jgi:hypothetical protein
MMLCGSFDPTTLDLFWEFWQKSRGTAHFL